MKKEYKKIMGVIRKEKHKRPITLINALINLKSHGFYYYRSKDARNRLETLFSKKQTPVYLTFYILAREYFTNRFPELTSQPGKFRTFILTKDDLPF